MSVQRTITLVEDDDGWTGIDEDTGLECRGEERAAVLERLDDVVAISFDEDDGADDGEDAVGDGTRAAATDEGDEALEWFEE